MKNLDDYIEICNLINIAQINLIHGDLSSIENLFSYSEELENWYNTIDDEFILHGEFNSLEKDFNNICDKIREENYPKKIDIIEETITILDKTHRDIGSCDVEDKEYKQWKRLLGDLKLTENKLNEIKEIWK